MDTNSPETKNYLAELYQMTGGDVDAQVSMFDVGAAIGLEKDSAGKTAEDLIGNGFVEVKTLSGGISITVQGIEKVQSAGLAGATTAAGFVLGDGPVLDETDRDSVATILREIQAQISQKSMSCDRLEEMVLDLKTIEVQMLSPRPKTTIIREVLRSLHSTLDASGRSDLSDKIEKMIST